MPHDPVAATAAAAANRHARARWLVEIREGEHTLDDTIRTACTPEGEHLLKLRIDDIVCALNPDMSARSRDLFIAKLRQYTDAPRRYVDRDLTLGWLLKNNQRNPGALPHRLSALYDALDTSAATRAKRFYGWPFSYPEHVAAVWDSPEMMGQR